MISKLCKQGEKVKIITRTGTKKIENADDSSSCTHDQPYSGIKERRWAKRWTEFTDHMATGKRIIQSVVRIDGYSSFQWNIGKEKKKSFFDHKNWNIYGVGGKEKRGGGGEGG